MPVFKILFILFLVVPLLEIYILVKVGSVIGALPTILLCIFTAALGAALLRHQGIRTLARVREKLDQGEIPAVDLLAGLILLFSGLLLLTPGFFTDIFGFACLIPRWREYLAGKFLLHQVVHYRRRGDDGVVIVEGEYWEDEERQKRLRR